MGRSTQAINDSKLVGIIKDTNSTSRQKQSAFNELYNTHERQLRLFFMKALAGKIDNVEDSADLMMMTFEKVHKNINSFDEKKAVFSTWMYKIAQNTLIDLTRTKKLEVLSIDKLSTKTSEDNEGMEFQIEGNSLTPEQEMIKAQNAEAVHNAIDSIDNDFIKDLMKLRYIEELSFEEAAEKMGVELNSTVRVNVHRGVAILKEKLASL